jgi:hypothetical protein
MEGYERSSDTERAVTGDGMPLMSRRTIGARGPSSRPGCV